MVDVVQMLKRGQLVPLGKVDNEIDKFNYTNCTIKLNSLNLETFKVAQTIKPHKLYNPSSLIKVVQMAVQISVVQVDRMHN